MNSGDESPAPDNEALKRAVDETRAIALRVAHDPTRAEKLARSAARKADRNEGAVRRVYQYIKAFSRMLRAYARREYRAVPWRSIILITAALLYFVSPFDLIPDILPGGFVDDVALIASIVKQIQSDLDQFLAWEIRDTSEDG